MDLKTLESTVKGFWGSDALLENDGGKPLKKFKGGKGKPPKDFVGLFVSESEAGKVIGKISWGNPGSGVYTGDCVAHFLSKRQLGERLLRSLLSLKMFGCNACWRKMR